MLELFKFVAISGIVYLFFSALKQNYFKQMLIYIIAVILLGSGILWIKSIKQKTDGLSKRINSIQKSIDGFNKNVDKIERPIKKLNEYDKKITNGANKILGR